MRDADNLLLVARVYRDAITRDRTMGLRYDGRVLRPLKVVDTRHVVGSGGLQ